VISKDIKAMAERYGFSLVRQKKHFVFKHPSGAVFVCGKSASDYRAIRNAERDIRKLLEKHHGKE
jgi:predicted RNA binding protein YcfA (HicA-like mRNA interferase family)